MLAATDAEMGAMIRVLKAKGMWANTVMFYSADNGGTDRGSNWKCWIWHGVGKSPKNQHPGRARGRRAAAAGG